MPADSFAFAGPVILDSGAVIAWLEREPGFDIVEQVMEDHRGYLHMAALNVCEVLYHFRRRLGAPGIVIARARIASAGVVEHATMDPAMVDVVATLKADIVRVSLADCCLLALAQRLGGHVLTTDRKELDTPGPLAVCPIHFIR